MPLFHLIALIINAHPLGADCRTFAFNVSIVKKIRKTNLFQDRSEGARLNNAWMWIARGSSPLTIYGSISSSRCQTTNAHPVTTTVDERKTMA
jgi:hypothetical protein